MLKIKAMYIETGPLILEWYGSLSVFQTHAQPLEYLRSDN